MFICQCKANDAFISALWQVLLLPWKPLGMLLPGVVSWLPVPQPAIAVEAFDVVAVTCQDVQTAVREKSNDRNSVNVSVSLQLNYWTQNMSLHSGSSTGAPWPIGGPQSCCRGSPNYWILFDHFLQVNFMKTLYIQHIISKDASVYS